MTSFERSFTVRFPRERVWSAFTDGAERSCWGPAFDIDATPGGEMSIDYGVGDAPPVAGTVVDVDPLRRFSWREGPGLLPGPTEFTVTFEDDAHGTRITVTHAGFGDDGDWVGALEAHRDGWEQAIADLELYLATAVPPRRMFTMQSDVGMALESCVGGLRVLNVDPGGFAASAGLRRDDVLLRIGGVSIYTRFDLWSAMRVYASGDDAPVAVIRDGQRVEAVGTF